MTMDPTAASIPVVKESRSRLLVGAFIAQFILTTACIVITLKMYENFKNKLNEQYTRQQRIAAELADQKKELEQTKVELGQAYFQGGLSLIRAGSADAIEFFRGGVKSFPDDPYMRGGLIRAFLTQGKKEEALKFASALPADQSKGYNLLMLAVALCANGQNQDAVQTIRNSHLDPKKNDDVVKFCPRTVLDQAALPN
jgi:predicted Zn-dependent protease